MAICVVMTDFQTQKIVKINSSVRSQKNIFGLDMGQSWFKAKPAAPQNREFSFQKCPKLKSLKSNQRIYPNAFILGVHCSWKLEPKTTASTKWISKEGAEPKQNALTKSGYSSHPKIPLLTAKWKQTSIINIIMVSGNVSTATAFVFDLFACFCTLFLSRNERADDGQAQCGPCSCLYIMAGVDSSNAKTDLCIYYQELRVRTLYISLLLCTDTQDTARVVYCWSMRYAGRTGLNQMQTKTLQARCDDDHSKWSVKPTEYLDRNQAHSAKQPFFKQNYSGI